MKKLIMAATLAALTGYGSPAPGSPAGRLEG